MERVEPNGMNREPTQHGMVCLLLAALVGGVCTMVGCGDAEPEAELAARVGQPTQTPEEGRQQGHTAFYRSSRDDTGEPATIPPVLLTEGHEALCSIGVGDKMPAIELGQLGGRRTSLDQLFGRAATVVLFWKSDRAMARTALADLGPDIVEPYASDGVAVVGIAEGESSGRARSVLRQAGATFPNLLDTDGEALGQVGSERLPRIYLLDPAGKVLWFDIEYSHSTRRELAQALEAVLRPEQ